MLRKVLGAERSKHLPPIKRGACADVYLTSSGQDQMVYHITMINIINLFFCSFHFVPVLQEMRKYHFNFDPRMLSMKIIDISYTLIYFMFVWINCNLKLNSIR